MAPPRFQPCHSNPPDSPSPLLEQLGFHDRGAPLDAFVCPSIARYVFRSRIACQRVWIAHCLTQLVRDVRKPARRSGADCGRDDRFQGKATRRDRSYRSLKRRASVYELIREDIIERPPRRQRAPRGRRSRPPPRHLDQPGAERPCNCCGVEGFVVFTPNRGARVRPIDQDFVPRHLRDRRSDRARPDPLVRQHGDATRTSKSSSRSRPSSRRTTLPIPYKHSELDTAFHTVMYQRHYNRHAAELWWKHREVLRAVGRRFNFTLSRRAAVMREHRELIDHVRRRMPRRPPRRSPAMSKARAGTSWSRCARSMRRARDRTAHRRAAFRKKGNTQ